MSTVVAADQKQELRPNMVVMIAEMMRKSLDRVAASDPGHESRSLDDIESIPTLIERGIFNWTVDYCTCKGIVKNWKNPKFKSLYVSKARSVVSNLGGLDTYVGNMRLLVRLLEKEFECKDLAYMKPENVFPEVWKSVIDMKLLRDQYCEKPEAMTDQYKCGRCKKRECVYQEIQLRSADEPMSLFITCLNCGNRWRMG